MSRARVALRCAVVVLGVACGQPAVVETPRPPPPKTLQLNRPGELVRVELAPGYVTVLDFWGDHCDACKVVGEMLETGVANEPKILIRKVDVGDGFTAVAEAYEIGTLPHYRIFDKKGKMRYLLVGNETTKATELAKQLAAEP